MATQSLPNTLSIVQFTHKWTYRVILLWHCHKWSPVQHLQISINCHLLFSFWKKQTPVAWNDWKMHLILPRGCVHYLSQWGSKTLHHFFIGKRSGKGQVRSRKCVRCQLVVTNHISPSKDSFLVCFLMEPEKRPTKPLMMLVLSCNKVFFLDNLQYIHNIFTVKDSFCCL